jgi:hypothetical protein
MNRQLTFGGPLVLFGWLNEARDQDHTDGQPTLSEARRYW